MIGRLKKDVGVLPAGSWVVWRAVMSAGHQVLQVQGACDAWNVWRDVPCDDVYIDPFARPLERAGVGEFSIPETLLHVVIGYLDAALWSSTDSRYPEGEELDGDDYHDEPFDRWAGIVDCSDRLIVHSLTDCESVMTQVGGAFDRYCDRIGSCGDGSTPAERFGHDLWLTRNGHGAGFWDRGLDSLGGYLSDVASSMGGVDIYSVPIDGATDEIEQREVTL